ncbi:hypothetical protein OIN60_19955 [Paenibacillus sp. P96]|uniref:Uncharacterized protein n=1 Tax=Paenibacillus zeirhizosphaerae TaxID=2987519 RepID=A0ABT9FW95_9BACL|nr:hypothetical protein [Paenibacillus sp. P96]MDP4099003.1 hypothetical protein [Paenibacillus sp. P96]
MNDTEKGFKTIMITVNGKPINKELVIDSVTYAPIQKKAVTRDN